MARIRIPHETATHLQNLMKKCEENPEELTVPVLNARAALVEHYQRLEQSEETEKALQDAAASFWKLLSPELSKSPAILEAARKLAGLHIKAGYLEIGEDMFLKIESDAVESFGEDEHTTMAVLIAIGIFYQEQNRWENAQPRFEQALSAAMTAYGLHSEITGRLELALEKKEYTLPDSSYASHDAQPRTQFTYHRAGPYSNSRRRRFLIDS